MSFLTNRSAMVWAFDEVIDKGTDFEGNNNLSTITEMKIIIDYLLTKNIHDKYITHDILIKFRQVIDKTKWNLELELEGKQLKGKQYFLVGWREHAILLFTEEQLNEEDDEDEFFSISRSRSGIKSRIKNKLFNLGIVNCGQGAELQGSNHDLCNGILIFKNIPEKKINDFIKFYKTFYKNCMADSNFTVNKRYYSFYFMLFDKILNKPNVDIKSLIEQNLVDSYKINSQIIGSCGFTNFINYIYYIACGDTVISYHLYLNWYNRCKEELKKSIYNEIIAKNDLKYYNIYRYIIDTTPFSRNDIYECTRPLIKKREIKPPVFYNNNDKNISRDNINNIFWYKYLIDVSRTVSLLKDETLMNQINSLSTVKEFIIISLWRIYDENDNSEFLHLLKANMNLEQLLFISLFVFYDTCNYFDNNMSCIIPLLQLYDLKKRTIYLLKVILI